MNSKEIAVVFEIATVLADGKILPKTWDLARKQQWVVKRLAESVGVYTIPIGSNWGYPISLYPVSFEEYNTYWNKQNQESTLP
jgi:hypothetical protein